MKKAVLFALGLLFCLTAPSFAQSYMDSKSSDVQSDAAAIHKDNVAIGHDETNLAVNRAKKARAKANGDTTEQALDSVKIGANRSAISEKKTEKDVDRNIMNHDEQQ